jgi:cell division protease FtsH
MAKEPEEKQGQEESPRGRSFRRGPNLWLLLILLVVIFFVFVLKSGSDSDRLQYTFLKEQIEKGNIKSVSIGEQEGKGEFVNKEGPEKTEENYGKPVKTKQSYKKNFHFQLPSSDAERRELYRLLDEHGVTVDNTPPDNTMNIVIILLFTLPLVFILFMWISYRRTQNQMLGGGGFLSGFSKSPAKRYEGEKQRITFADVAGLEGVKADLMEIVEFLRSPEKFQKLGGRVPKGVLLNGSPGTGKTLLARAVAGEADAPFYSVSGSEFIQMFVGVGASRVRDLFKQAKDTGPSIIFIDEIDAVGRQRGAGLGGGHDEREQTLNQILSEMDGFAQNDSVIVLAATNRPDVLDPALLRPGRFDRHVTVGRPTQKGRVEIFKVHVRDVPLAADVNLERLAAGTVGLTGADIRNIVNEAALWAARHDKTKVDMSDFEHARDRVLMGAKREEVISDEEKEKTAYHEAGHTLIAWNLIGSHRVHKVTISPRGRALGATQMMPGEDRLNMAEHELRDNLIVLLGGRAAEKIVYDEMTVGAENDLERATSMARRMVTHWGMSERLGPVSYKMSEEDPFLGREMHQQRQFSEHTMELIDEEVARILHESSDKSISLLKSKRDQLEALAKALIEEEELGESQITEIVGPSVHARAASNGKPSTSATDANSESSDAAARSKDTAE